MNVPGHEAHDIVGEGLPESKDPHALPQPVEIHPTRRLELVITPIKKGAIFHQGDGRFYWDTIGIHRPLPSLIACVDVGSTLDEAPHYRVYVSNAINSPLRI